MLKKIQAFFEHHFVSDDEAGVVDENHELHLATAVLMMEIAHADMHIEGTELNAMAESLGKSFDLSADDTKEIIALAKEEVDQAVSSYPFTRRLNESLDARKKEQVIEMLWRVALSDQNLDKYEEGMIRKLADLLYVPHSGFIRAKHAAQAALER